MRQLPAPVRLAAAVLAVAASAGCMSVSDEGGKPLPAKPAAKQEQTDRGGGATVSGEGQGRTDGRPVSRGGGGADGEGGGTEASGAPSASPGPEATPAKGAGAATPPPGAATPSRTPGGPTPTRPAEPPTPTPPPTSSAPEPTPTPTQPPEPTVQPTPSMTPAAELRASGTQEPVEFHGSYRTTQFHGERLGKAANPQVAAV
ncbi:hypothetical protein [Streptomyces sp. NPDC051561]|uniref:hypothetical protein n=1 Tax=Streptomyces sp. NPDC051561 TaxID=3365658 RepID=UPI0037B47EE7